MLLAGCARKTDRRRRAVTPRMRTDRPRFGAKTSIIFLIYLVLCTKRIELQNIKMVAPRRAVNPAVCLYLIQLATQVLAGTQFNSHVSVSTPSRSFSHGVGDPLPQFGRRMSRLQHPFTSFRHPSVTSHQGGGYPRVRPAIPFDSEDLPRRSAANTLLPWQNNRYVGVTIPLLPPSPYKVDSPDPESLWPEGLFLPPIAPPRYGSLSRRSDVEADNDPYLLEGSEAIAAVARAKDHGELYFHDIPHIESLLANQELRVKNNLKPHILGSIRHTWQFYRD